MYKGIAKTTNKPKQSAREWREKKECNTKSSHDMAQNSHLVINISEITDVRNLVTQML